LTHQFALRVRRDKPRHERWLRFSTRTILIGLLILGIILYQVIHGAANQVSSGPIDAASIKARSVATQHGRATPAVRAEWAADIRRDCQYVGNKTALAVPLQSFSEPLANNNNNGYPLALCRSTVACKDNPSHPNYNNVPMITNAVGTMINGLPSCEKTFIKCLDGQKYCPLTAERAANGRGVGEFFAVNFDFSMTKVDSKESKATVRWNPKRNASRGHYPNLRKYPQIIELAFVSATGSDAYAQMCHGQVLVKGQFNPGEVYCMGDLRGCPPASECLDSYRTSVSQSGNSAQVSLVPMGKDVVPENVFDR
jgi:hypothetical protein